MRPPPRARAAARRAAKAALPALPLQGLAWLPAHGGSVGRRALLAQAHQRRAAGRPEEALRLLDRVPHAQLPPRGHVIRAHAWEDLGRPERGLRSARAATESRPVDVTALVARLRLARALGDADEVMECVDLAALAAPRNRREAEALARAYRSEDPDALRRFRTAMRGWAYPASTQAEVRLDTEELTARGATPEEIADIARVEASDSAPGLERAVLRLSGEQNWAALAEVLRGRTVEGPLAKELGRDAGRALKEGRADEAAAIAEAALRSGRGMSLARSVHSKATEQSFIARSGWPVEVARARPYEPQLRSTLSVLAQSLPQRSGGYATRSHGILTGLRARGWEAQAVTRLGFPYDRWPSTSTEEVPHHEVVDGVPYHRLLEPGERVYSTTPMSSYIERFTAGIVEQARSQRAALIHAASFQNNGLAALAAARRLGLPFVYEMRGLEDLMKVSRDPCFASTTAHAYMTTLENHIVRQADLTFVITEALREEMIRRGGPADRIEVLPNGVNTRDFQPAEPDEALAAELGLRGRTVIGYAGGLVDYEGLELLIEAAADLAVSRSDFVVLLVGDGHIGPRLRRLVERCRLTDVVRFTGRVPHDQVARYLSVFDITPFPRLPLPVCELISPIKPFEAMSMGKAVVASSVAALTEIVEPDVRGLVFDKGDHRDLAAALERYLDSPELRAAMGTNARTWVRAERDWSDVVPVVDAAYRRLTGETWDDDRGAATAGGGSDGHVVDAVAVPDDL